MYRLRSTLLWLIVNPHKAGLISGCPVVCVRLCIIFSLFINICRLVLCMYDHMLFVCVSGIL